MVSGVKKDSGDFIYMRLKKHVCPDCGQKVFVKKVKKVIKAGSRAAKDYDFTVGDITLDGKVKFIWYEFKCTGCGNMTTEADMKAYEKRVRAEEKAEKKAAKKAEKKAKKESKKAEKETAK